MKVDEKKISIATRRKMARVAKRTAKKRQLKKKLLAKRRKSNKKLKVSAQKAAKNVLVKKLTGGKSYSDLSITQKQSIDKKLKPSIIARVAKKMLPKVRAKEKERVKRARQKKMTENKHGVLTLKVNGSYPEVSARYINGKLKPYVFKTKEDAKNHCKNVGGKPFESTDTGNFYVEFTKIDGPNNMSENNEDKKELKAMLDIAKMLSDKSAYFKGRGSKKEYIKMLVHKIKKLSEAKKQKLMTKMDAYKKVRKATLPKSIPMKSKKTYDRKDFKKGKYD
tara:strand:- start:761 stop:1597 length:837 start_codon:yes stop_codon:yes gene_type:complete